MAVVYARTEVGYIIPKIRDGVPQESAVQVFLRDQQRRGAIEGVFVISIQDSPDFFASWYAKEHGEEGAIRARLANAGGREATHKEYLGMPGLERELKRI